MEFLLNAKFNFLSTCTANETGTVNSSKCKYLEMKDKLH
jgi:hypothetical protein